MYFKISTTGASITNKPPCAVLVLDNWDDWFTFNTMYTLHVYDGEGTRHHIGSVKIGQFGMKPNQKRPDLDTEFDCLDDRFFSLGQDDSYYDRLNESVPHLRDEVLSGLQDLAYCDADRFTKALDEKVTTESLLRSVAVGSVRDQFRRVALGGVRLSEYNFSYSTALLYDTEQAEALFSFDVHPDSHPPTNIHVVIGRNGVGKTHLLNAMSRALINLPDDEADHGCFSFPEEAPGTGLFVNIVSVTFSAFDPFAPIGVSQTRDAPIQYSYIGLKQVHMIDEDATLAPKTPQMLEEEFTVSAKLCKQGARADRWLRALRTLESDPIFKDANVTSLVANGGVEAEAQPSTGAIFGRLSSGHKIVLLTITRLVETVAERTLVLLDEPEAHLHPPLLSAFIRALSDLLINRNGVAIVATHSPVILQEVPRSCVWKLRRSGYTAVAERPEIETFGENVGILTREVFGLEVTNSGFHKLLTETVTEASTYEEVLERFNNELGGEARAIVMGLIAVRDEEDET